VAEDRTGVTKRVDGVIIRTMGLRDFPRVLAIERQCFPLNNSLGLLLYYWLFDRGGLLVAETGGQVVGYVITRRTVLGGLRRYGHVVSLAVEASHRRQGIGRRLMEAALAHLAQRRVATVGLEVRLSNRAAQALYEQLGFESGGIIRGYYSDGEDAYRMVKGLGSEATAAEGAAARAEET
jgi:ribosomal-protein-alanine N-acetyltransferase